MRKLVQVGLVLSADNVPDGGVNGVVGFRSGASKTCAWAWRTAIRV